MSGIGRRRFLHYAGGAAAGLVSGIALPRVGLAQPFEGSRPRTLIVVDLQGGNDALNTLVPATGLYHDARPTIGLDEDSLLEFDGLRYGVHPALSDLESLWDGGQIAAVYGTGLDGQGRSHFVAQDAWRTARPGMPARSGWLGRYLEKTAMAHSSALRAIALGQSTLAAQGEQGRPVAVQSVDGFRLRPPKGHDAVTAAVLAMAQGADSSLFGQAQAAIPRTVEAVEQLQSLIASTQAGSDEDLVAVDDGASLFRAAQAIVQGDVGAEVLYITVDGFDTHALQSPRHAQLLGSVGGGVRRLFDAFEESGHADDVLVLVVSEFGRRVVENGSSGTDHGRGGLSLLIGPAVARSLVVGEPDLTDLVDEDLRITTDARSVYRDALGWLGATDAQAAEVLDGDWPTLDVLE